jgi:outer membrane protein TolC
MIEGMGRVLLVAAVLASAQTARADDTLSLEQAIHLALTRNERSAIAELDFVAAEASVSRAKVAFLPALTATGNDTVHPIDHPVDTANGSLTFSQPLVVPSAFPLLDQAKHNLDAQRAATVEDKRQLAFDVARAYFAVLLAQEVVAAAQKKLDTATADVASTDAQFKAQLVSSNDVTRAKISLASSQRELEVDRGNLGSAFVQLGFIINAPPPKVLAEPTAVLAAGRVPVPPPNMLVGQGLAHRPDLVERKASALAAHDFAREPTYRFFPTLSLVSQLTATSNAPSMGHAVDGTIAVTASWQIYDAGARNADERLRAANAAIADLDTVALARTIDSQVRSAAIVLESAQAALGAAQEAVDASRKSADETAILYHQGLAKAIELVDANEQRFVAEVNYAEAEYSVANAYLALRQAMGAGPIEEGK